MSTVYISFSAEIIPNTAETLIAATFDQINRGAKHIYYLFSTPGGIVANGIALYNIIKGLPIETTMHNTGNVDSIGNAIFLAAKNRVTCKHSTFMFHGVGFDTNSPIRLEEKMLREHLGGVLADQKRIGGIIADETSLKGEDIDRLFLEAQTKDADFAMQNGMVSDVREVNIPPGAPLLQLVFQR